MGAFFKVKEMACGFCIYKVRFECIGSSIDPTNYRLTIYGKIKDNDYVMFSFFPTMKVLKQEYVTLVRKRDNSINRVRKSDEKRVLMNCDTLSAAFSKILYLCSDVINSEILPQYIIEKRCH
jgi:hypothetical protein